MSIAALIRRMRREGHEDHAIIQEAIRAAELAERPPSDGYQPRMGTGARKKAFEALCERDGAECSECAKPHEMIWRRAGAWSCDDWGCNEDGRPFGIYSKVNASSCLEVDHRTPLHLGGTNDIDNLWLLCRDCHKQKSAREQSDRLKRLFADGRQ